MLHYVPHMDATIKPLGYRVLCKEVETDSSFQGSPIILLADTVAEATKQQAEVVAVGSKVESADVVPGAWILHTPFARQDAPDGMFWVNESDIVAVLS